MNNFDDKYDLLLKKAMIENAKNEGVALESVDLITIEDGKISEDNAKVVSNEIANILNIKNKLFSDISLDDLEDSEYERLLEEFHNSIKVDINEDRVVSIKNRYPNINFDNLDERTPNLILSGDVLYEATETAFGSDGDYSPVIMQWCRAVELELRNKIYSYLSLYSIKSIIERKSEETVYYIEGKRRNPNFRKLIVNDMMGFYGAMKKFGLENFIFNTYIKIKYSNFKIEDFEKIIEYVNVVNNYRDNSAHSITQIDLNKSSADDCKDYIVASKKILEILSNLKKN